MASPFIPATDPTVTPAVDSATYDQWRLGMFNVQAQDPNGQIRVAAGLRKMRVLQDGTVEDAPSVAPVRVVIGDFMTYAKAQAVAGDTSYLDTMTALLASIQKYAASQNLI